MSRRAMRNRSNAATVAFLLAMCAAPLRAQSPAHQDANGPVQAEARFPSIEIIHTTAGPLPLLEHEKSGMPAWLKWGLIGGAGMAAFATLATSWSIESDPPSAGESAAKGFVVGFVVVGGGVAVYQAICKPGGWSESRGLCDRARRRN